jgi:hypothetical protein
VVRKPFAVPHLVAAVNRALAAHATITGRALEHPTSQRAEPAAAD